MKSPTRFPACGPWCLALQRIAATSALLFIAVFCAGFLKAAVPSTQEPGLLLLEKGTLHLGVPGRAEWEEAPARTVDAERGEWRFAAHANAGEATLRIRQAGVKLTWPVFVNGRKIGALQRDEAAMETLFAVPVGALKEGENVLTINAPPSLDDIDVGPVWLSHSPLSANLLGAEIEVVVTDADTRAALPCRLTLTNAAGALVPLRAAPAQDLAVRTGVVYTRAGRARLTVPPGGYVLYAGRGFEWSVGRRELQLERGSSVVVEMPLKREVPTEGWVAADSHIHTLTHSGHGDATMEERALTIAGEGIELAIATDHNHHTDYAPVLEQTRLAGQFTPVVGNEITTKRGHFNAFPILPGAALVDAKEEDWSRLLPAIRATHGVQVITLNHPRDLHSGFVPFGEPQFDARSGALRSGETLGVDAIEVITSGALQSDIALLYRDWFALLNHGERVAAVASSDTHDVSRFILGQGRTYVAARDDDPARIPLAEAWQSYKQGRLLVSMGLLANIRVNQRFGVGDLASCEGAVLRVTATVLGPSWTRADHVALYSNGELLREQSLADDGRAGVKAMVEWDIPRPAHDVFLVVVATGPGVTAPYWEIPRPYQPSAPRFFPRVLGSTNPVWVDCDGDGKFQCALDYARTIVGRNEGDAQAQRAEAAAYGAPVALQLEALLQKAGL